MYLTTIYCDLCFPITYRFYESTLNSDIHTRALVGGYLIYKRLYGLFVAVKGMVFKQFSLR